MLSVNHLISKLENNSIHELTVDESFKYTILVNSLIFTSEYDGYKAVINILNYWHKIPKETHEIWANIIESAGFYPYLDKIKKTSKLNNLSGEIRKEYHLSLNLGDKYFHEEQLRALHIINSEKNLILSAPTSFGKSLLIEEIIASKKYKNIVIIQPTLALLDETRQKLLKYNETYKLIVRTSQEPCTEKGNIFLFTAERVNEYKHFTSVEFLVIDEFYKLSGKRDDERSSFLNNAFYILYKRFKPKFYFLGPNIDGISNGFEETYNAKFYKTDYSLVDNRVIDVYAVHKDKFGSRGNKKEYKENTLFELLYKLRDEQTIIYCSSPNRVRSLTQKFVEFLKLKKVNISKEEFTLIEWVEENISKEWYLIENLKYTVGMHDGSLFKHITSSIIDYFNEGKLKYIFCTSTIIEGVNTSAKNIIYFDCKKGMKNIDYFDYSNIKGRAGRLMVHYVGNIYNFNPIPDKYSYIIDIPFYEQNPVKDETLIQLECDDVLNKESEQYKKIIQISESDKKVIKANGVSVDGQIKILNRLRENFDEIYHLINWNGLPEYEQLLFVIDLAWDNLIIEGETTKPMSKRKLVQNIYHYVYKGKTIKEFILDTYLFKKNKAKESTPSSKLMNDTIQEVFQIVKHWFQYKVPKWLSVINTLQKSVCNEKGKTEGNYSYYASLLENDLIPENLTILLEYGVPSSAIKKIKEFVDVNISQDDVLKYINKHNIHKKAKLIKYEQEKIDKQLI